MSENPSLGSSSTASGSKWKTLLNKQKNLLQCFSQNTDEGFFVSNRRFLSSPIREKYSENGENSRLRFGLSAVQGWRPTMEDEHVALPDLDDQTSFFGVYDGHGGKVVAKFCAKYLHNEVLRNESYLAGDLGASAQRAFLRMDEMMQGQRGWRELNALRNKTSNITRWIEGLKLSRKKANSNDQSNEWASEKGPHEDFIGPKSGSTACVAIIRNNQLVVASAGDSRCVISRRRQAHDLSRDHKPAVQDERDRIVRAGGFIQGGRVNGSLGLTRAIGDMEFKQNKSLPPEEQIITANPEINIMDLSADVDFIVIACDGIWDCMTSQQLVDFIHQYIQIDPHLSVVCGRVLDRCLDPRGDGVGCDNMTIILVQFK